MALKKTKFLRTWVRIRQRCLKIFVMFLFFATLASTINRNYVAPFYKPSPSNFSFFDKAYIYAIAPYAIITRAFLVDTMWRMYSPAWRRSVWIEWYTVDRDRNLALWPTPQYGLNYRDSTPFWKMELFELKEPKIQSELNHTHFERIGYALHLCKKIESQTHNKPYAMKPIWLEVTTPPPDTQWTFSDLKITRYNKLPEVRCP